MGAKFWDFGRARVGACDGVEAVEAARQEFGLVREANDGGDEARGDEAHGDADLLVEHLAAPEHVGVAHDEVEALDEALEVEHGVCLLVEV